MIMLNLLLTFVLSLLTFSSEIKNTSWLNIDSDVYDVNDSYTNPPLPRVPCGS